jgi:hypothetical protein
MYFTSLVGWYGTSVDLNCVSCVSVYSSHSTMEGKPKPSLPSYFKENWESKPTTNVPTTFKSNPEFKKIIEQTTQKAPPSEEPDVSLKDLLYEVNGVTPPKEPTPVPHLEHLNQAMATIRTHVAEIARLDKALMVVFIQ